jgi:hypothetical protein
MEAQVEVSELHQRHLTLKSSIITIELRVRKERIHTYMIQGSAYLLSLSDAKPSEIKFRSRHVIRVARRVELVHKP